jgi:hypothetical protein
MEGREPIGRLKHNNSAAGLHGHRCVNTMASFDRYKEFGRKQRCADTFYAGSNFQYLEAAFNKRFYECFFLMN